MTEQNENAAISREYDAAGRLLKETESGGIEKQYIYDLTGNRKSFKLLQNSAVKQNMTYDYDSLKRLTKVYDNGTLIATYMYDANGNRASLAYNNGITATYAYNKANMVTSLDNKLGTTPVSSYSYTYYLDGNQETKTDNTGKLTTYVYDGLGRLKSEAVTGTSVNTTMAYTYDAAGNRATMTVTGAEAYGKTYTYDVNNRLLTETTTLDGISSTVQYAYDSNGNQLSHSENGVTETNGYDVFNRLRSAVKDGATATYTYKPDGLRLSKTVNGVKTTHVWNGNSIALDLDGSNAVVDSYIRGINLIKSQNNGYYLYNVYGDVTKLTNAAGAVTRSYEYDAFGVEQEQDEHDANPFRYCGEYFDLSSGTYYLRNRYYNPSNGRFLAEDSYEYIDENDPLSLNLYVYGKNNPIRYDDPSGNSARDIVYGFVTALDDSIFFGSAQKAIELLTGKLSKVHNSDYDYYKGRCAGDIIAMAFGTGASLWGIVEMGGSILGGGAVTIGSGGTLTIGGIAIVVNGAAVGATTTAAGANAVAMAKGNFGNDYKKMDELGKTERKKPVSGSGKEKATDKPSWVKEAPYKGESGNNFAKRLMDEKYGSGNYKTGPDSEFNKIKKWADRAFK